ncbi:MAG: NADH-quinone oxidoreductase subunit NuoB [Actinobacteria bacterium]|nr:NADH-quinone oxidoreductase subunit NuoB [Actinomycetota bacterium]
MALRPDAPHDRPHTVAPTLTPPSGAVVIPPAQVRRSLRSTDLDQVVMTTSLEKIFKMATANSMWPFGFGLACCAMEMIAMISSARYSSARYDVARFGSEVVRATPRQSDLMIVSGRVAHKMAEPIRQLYEQMLEPKYVMAMGACSSTGGMFSNYSILQGVDKIVPVDVYVPGCPPRPEAVVEGLMVLQERIKSGIPSASINQETQS